MTAMYSVEDGPGCASKIRMEIDVMVGTKRSTVLLRHPYKPETFHHQVIEHGEEAAAAAEAVRKIVAQAVAK
jgi:hypothetical protein